MEPTLMFHEYFNLFNKILKKQSLLMKFISWGNKHKTAQNTALRKVGDVHFYKIPQDTENWTKLCFHCLYDS